MKGCLGLIVLAAGLMWLFGVFDGVDISKEDIISAINEKAGKDVIKVVVEDEEKEIEELPPLPEDVESLPIDLQERLERY